MSREAGRSEGTEGLDEDPHTAFKGRTEEQGVEAGQSNSRMARDTGRVLAEAMRAESGLRGLMRRCIYCERSETPVPLRTRGRTGGTQLYLVRQRPHVGPIVLAVRAERFGRYCQA
ncbi:hypothetical protein BV20DRAFT_207682 [Pilatotrama ljubarskyi]|nr:hypothetical protein BV20DRAFT_207682 [Pilatotrama ljubarskyi]